VRVFIIDGFKGFGFLFKHVRPAAEEMKWIINKNTVYLNVYI